MAETLTRDAEPPPDLRPARPAAFPASLLAERTTHRRRRRRIIEATICLIAVAVATSSVVSRAGADDAARYRTATVGVHDVEQTITRAATVEPVSQASVAFPISGTVASVDVAVGDAVSTAQPLATLDGTALAATLHSEQADLATAQLTLQTELAGELVSTGANASAGPTSGSTGTTSAMASPSTTSPSSRSSNSASSGNSNGSSTELTSARQAVAKAQDDVDAARATADATMASATSVCATDGGSCQAALQASLGAQQAVGTAQATLASATDRLDSLLAQTSSAASSASSTSATSATSAPTNTSNANAANNAASSSSSSRTPTAADLVAAQQAVDAAEAAVAAAQQAIDQATIVSPIAGTVASVGVKPGDSVSSGSTTQTIVVVGAGGVEATTTVSVDDIGKVKVGQAASLVPDGQSQPITGTVTSISVSPTSSSSTSTASYRVVVGLDGDTSKLGNGSTGTLELVTASTTAALAVPTSAVTTSGTRHTVTVLDAGATRTVDVAVGPIGSTWTAITSGLAEGQTVVLADLSQPLPSSATSASSGTNRRTANGPNGATGPGFVTQGGGGGPGAAPPR